MSAFGLFACGANTQNVQKTEGIVKPLTKDKAAPYEVTVKQVRATFEEFLLTVSEGRELNTHDEKLDGGVMIKLGDVDGDGLEDAVVDYSLQPTYEETGGGNSFWEIPGVVIYKNTGEFIERVYHSQEYGTGYLIGIENGKIQFKVSEYAEDDARCCPSIEKIENYKFENKQLVNVR